MLSSHPYQVTSVWRLRVLAHSLPSAAGRFICDIQTTEGEWAEEIFVDNIVHSTTGSLGLQFHLCLLSTFPACGLLRVLLPVQHVNETMSGLPLAAPYHNGKTEKHTFTASQYDQRELASFAANAAFVNNPMCMTGTNAVADPHLVILLTAGYAALPPVYFPPFFPFPPSAPCAPSLSSAADSCPLHRASTGPSSLPPTSPWHAPSPREELFYGTLGFGGASPSPGVSDALFQSLQ